MSSEREVSIDEILKIMTDHFGKAVKSIWVYDGELCPCCRMWEIDFVDHNGEKALSINAYMYRERDVLIAYLLCGRCAGRVIAESLDGPTEMHAAIERNLADAYNRYLNSLDA